MSTPDGGPLGGSSPRPPIWLVLATAALAVTCLVLAVAETDLLGHYLIDGGEFLSLFGLGFILVAGVYLFRCQRLFVSLPLVLPWLIYPVITQGDQIIDDLSINPMRTICQVLLAMIFGAPVAVLALAARYLLAAKSGQAAVRRGWTAWFPGLRALAEGRPREGTGLLAAALLVIEIWVAHQFLGTLMVVTQMLMILAALFYASLGPPKALRSIASGSGREPFALIVLLVGVVLSFGLFVGYKNRRGAYQGSPSAFMDPTQKDKAYPLNRIVVPTRVPTRPAASAAVQQALTAYGRTLERLLAGYHILDRNYTYDFHNHLFLRQTPLMANYRTAGLQKVEEASRLRENADAQAATARATLADDDPLAALLDDVRGYVAFNFDRAPVLERLSAQFEQTPAGLQHAAHLYEGESKALGYASGGYSEETPASAYVLCNRTCYAGIQLDQPLRVRGLREARGWFLTQFHECAKAWRPPVPGRWPNPGRIGPVPAGTGPLRTIGSGIVGNRSPELALRTPNRSGILRESVGSIPA